MRLSSPLPFALALSVALSFGTLALDSSAQGARLPSLGDSISEDFDLITERRLGDQVMREIRRDPDLLDDPLLLAYVQSIWEPLVKAAAERGDISADTRRALAWEAFLVRDRSINAMALPGGYIGVYLGLIATTATPDELAGVLAHELAHVSQRHIARAIKASQKQTLVGLATLLAGLVAASKSRSGDAVQAAVAVGQAVSIQGQLNFSRDMEREADRVGFGIHQHADFAPAGMASMFEKLESAHRLNDHGDYPYLRTHPLSVERIGDARARAATVRDAKPATTSIEHEFMRARARVLMDRRTQSLRHVAQAALSVSPQTPALERATAHYAAALAHLELREGAAAQRALQAMQGQLSRLATEATKGSDPLASSPSIKSQADERVRAVTAMAQAQALALVGQEAQALALVAAAPPGAPRATMLLTAEVSAQAVRRGAEPSQRTALELSAERLLAWVTEHKDDALAWQHLARANELLGRRLRSLRADAEAQAALGDLLGAIDRFRAGQRLAREVPAAADPIELAVIDARARELVALRKELYPDDRRRP